WSDGTAAATNSGEDAGVDAVSGGVGTEWARVGVCGWGVVVGSGIVCGNSDGAHAVREDAGGIDGGRARDSGDSVAAAGYESGCAGAGDRGGAAGRFGFAGKESVPAVAR